MLSATPAGKPSSYGAVRRVTDRKESRVRRRIQDMISHTLLSKMPRPADEGSEQYFKALTVASASGGSANHGYQAKEQSTKERSQFPIPLFPTTLASYVVVFTMDNEWVAILRNAVPKPKSYAKQTAQPLIDKMRSADMIVREFANLEQKKFFALISVSEKRQKMVAQLMGPLIYLRFKKTDDEGNEVKNGGGWCVFKQHLSPLYERCSEGTLFSSCQQCQIIEFLLNDVDERALGPQLIQKDACEPGNTPLMQLKKDEKISDYFYLHHEDKKKWLLTNWSETYVRKQPIEDIREYFGEEVALYFIWMGYLLTTIWVPAFTGIFVFFMGFVAFVQSGTFDSPYVPLFCIFVSLWAIMFISGWKQLELTYQHEWDTVEYEEPNHDRTEFVQDKKTYKRLNELSKKEEYYPDPLWRWIAIILSCVLVPTFMVLQVMGSITVDLFEASLAPFLGGKYGAGAIVGAVLQGIFIVLVMHLFDQFVSKRLTNFENWQTDRQYKDARIVKYTFFADVALTFSIYFWAFIGNKVHMGVDLSCPDDICYDYLMIKVPILVITIKLARKFIIPAFVEFDRRFDMFLTVLPSDPSGALKKLFPPDAPPKKDDGDEDAAAGASGGAVEVQEHAASNEESLLPPSDPWDLCKWYLEKLMDLTWVALFSGAFPLLPLLFLLVQVLELREHAGALLSRTQRRRHSRVRDLGILDELMEILVLMCILTQCCVLAFASNGLLYYFPDLSDSQRVFYAVAVEHLLLLFKVVWERGGDEAPDEAKTAYERKKYEKKLLLKELDHLDEKKDVVFYTSDDGEAYYGKK